MLRWCALTRNRSIVKEGVQCQEDQTSKYTYKPLDMDFRKEVDAVALQCFQKEVFKDLGKFPYATDYLKQENQQLKIWIKNIEIILKKIQGAKLKTISGYRVEWENSEKVLLEKLNIENTNLRKKIDRDNEEMQFLENLIEGIVEKSEDVISPMDRLSIDLLTETVSESMSTKQKDELVRRVSEESGYATDSSEDTIKAASSCSSIDTVLAEEPDPYPLADLQKQNTTYREWVNSLHKKLNSNLTVQFMKPSKTLENLRILSFENVELKQEMKRNQKAIQYLQYQLEEIEEVLEKGISQSRIDPLEKSVREEQEELEAIDRHLNKLQKKTTKLHRRTELSTTCLQEIGKFLVLLKSTSSF